ncbi:MAG: glycosyltransferase family 2 protein, partial [Puniceicoccales bacterium]
MISVIIPTCKRPDLLALCLDALAPDKQVGMKLSLAGSAADSATYEVIVTDDGAAQDSACGLDSAYPWARFIAGPGRGPAANRNNGVRYARGEFIAFLDDDCIPASDWLSGFRHSPPDIEALEGKTVADRPKARVDEESPVNETGGYLWTCNMMIRRAAFQQLNGFDELFPYAAMEDVDFRVRFLDAGMTFRFAPEAVVTHPWRRGNSSAHEKRLLSHYHFWRQHPELRPANMGVFFFKQLAGIWGRDYLPSLIKFRGQGTVYCLVHTWVLLKATLG